MSRVSPAERSTAPAPRPSRQEQAALSSAAARSTVNTSCESSIPPASRCWTTVKSARSGCRDQVWPSATTAGRSRAARYSRQNSLRRAGRYLRTGDLGFLRSGELFVTGRIKDLVIVNGRNIYPQDVEGAVVRANPDFRLAVAFSIPDKSSEQLCVVAETGHRNVSGETYSTMVEAIRSSIISEFGIRPHIHIAPKRTIPTTTSGKVRRQETRRMFLANELRSVHVDAVQECTA